MEGGEIKWSDTYNIKYRVSKGINKVSIALYVDDKWYLWIVKDMSLSDFLGESYDFSYSWKLSNNISESNVSGFVKPAFKIYIIGYKSTGGTVEDKSDTPFSIVAATTAPSITVLSPNGGEKWQLYNTHTITWTPYDPNNNINPAGSAVVAYLEKQREDGQFINYGKIIPAGKASIHWEGVIDRFGNYAEPGDYYIRVVNTVTGASDRSNRPFTLVAKDTIKADIKVNNSDEPITLPTGGATYTVSWTSSNTSNCELYNSGSQERFSNLPSSGSKTITVMPVNAYSSYISINCLGSSIEGSAYDSVEIKMPSLPITIISPNGGEKWQIGSTNTITWNPYDPNTGVNPSYDVAAYLDRKTTLGFEQIGKIIPAGRASIHWNTGEIWIEDGKSGYSKFAEPGDYYIRVVNIKTGDTDRSNAPFSIVVAGGNTDIEMKNVYRGTDFHPYGFYSEYCVSGSKSINDLKKENPKLTYFPAAYYVYDSQGRQYRGDASISGSVEDLKNGQCSGKIGWTIQLSEQSFYDQTKRVDFVLDPDNLINEINENNNKASFSEPISTPSITVLSPNGGESWTIGKVYNINWQSVNMPSDASVQALLVAYTSEKSGYGSVVWQDFTSASSNGLALEVPSSITPGLYMLRLIVSSKTLGAAIAEDFSNSYFSIVAPTTTQSNVSMNTMASTLESAKNILIEMAEYLKGR